jgi:hypothetical protein
MNDIIKPRQKEQPRRQMQARQAQAPTDAVSAGPLSEWDVLWCKYCKLAFKLYHSDQLAEFQNELHAGRLLRVTEPLLMTAAIHLVSGMAPAGVRRWDWLPAPATDDLVDPAGWAAQRLAAERTSQEGTERTRRMDQMIARAFGQPRSGGSGTINPVYLQKLKYSLEELARRLEQAMSKGGFRREDLDHRSPNYISVAKGGISNKQITIMACMIAGRTPRSFDESWNIVTEFLRKHRAEQS